MVYCPECGRKNPDDARVCSYCGAELTEAARIREFDRQEASVKQPKKESKLGLIIIALVVVAVIIAVIAAVSFIFFIGETAEDVIKGEGECRYDYSIRTTQNIDYHEAKEGYKFAIVTLRIQNNATHHVSTNRVWWNLIINEIIYDSDIATSSESINYTDVEVSKGGDFTTEIVYEVPAASTDYNLKYTGFLAPKMIRDDTLL